MTSVVEETETKLDITSLDKRLTMLTLFRIALVGSIAIGKLYFPHQLEISSPIKNILIAYCFVATAEELTRRIFKRGHFLLMNAILLVDGLFVTILIGRAGGITSNYLIVAYLQLTAVSLLLSYSTGMKATIWDSLLLVCLSFAMRAGAFTSLIGKHPGIHEALNRDVVFRVSLLIITSLATAALASVSERELRRRKNDSVLMAHLAVELAEHRRPAQIANIFIESLVRSFQFTRAAILVTLSSGEWWLRTDTGRVFLLDAIDVDDDLIALATERDGYLMSRRFNAMENRNISLAIPNGRNLVLMSLKDDDRSLAVVIAEWNPKRDEIPFHTLETFEQMCRHASLALRNADLLVDIERLATTDALTGLSNRRVFEESLKREIARADRNREELSLAMIDLDHFKWVNDSFGHIVGDEVLIEVGQAILDTCRESDLPVRYGGEEICIVMPNCSSSQAVIATERIRKAIHERTQAALITASAGVASYPMNAGSYEELIAASDDALYEAKQEGRDCTVASSAHGVITLA